MPKKFFALVLKNMFRSRTRTAVTVAGCVIAAFVICFILSAEGSLTRMLDASSGSQNLIVAQKDIV